MTATSVSLAQVRTLGVPIAWHEAVAIAFRCAERLQATAVVAGFDTCLISTAGEVEVNAGSSIPFAGNPLYAVAAALVDKKDAPPALVTLLDRHAPEPSSPPETLAAEMAFFRRADLEAAVRAVAMRASAKEREAQAQTEFDRLRADAIVSATASSDIAKPPVVLSWRTLRSAVGASAVLLAGILLWLFPWREASLVADSPPVVELTAAIARVVDHTLRAGSVLETPSVSPMPSVTANMIRPRNIRQPRRDSSSSAVLTSRPVLPAGGLPVTVAAVPGTRPGTDRQREDDVDEFVYSNTDLAVTPPVLMRAQLRSTPDFPAVLATTYLELLVNEEGGVERVRLHAARSSLHDRMLIAAAKAWRFRPATSDGRPVKYALRVAIPREDER